MSTEVKDTYLSVADSGSQPDGQRIPSGEGLFKDNGSRFIATAYQVRTEDEVKEIVASLRKVYHDARHHCYAYRLGADGSVFRASDDGEPAGSSGRPILGQIDSAGLSDVLVVVVRYFGGIKLGIPGLIRAYKTSSAEALENSPKVTKVATRRFCISFPYTFINEAIKISREFSVSQCAPEYGADSCSLALEVPLSRVSQLVERVEDTRTAVLEDLTV